MQDWLLSLEAKLDSAEALDGGLDAMAEAMQIFGLDSVNYDYAPVPLTRENEIVTPTLLMTRNAPESMIELWRNEGYYQIDPVMRVANSRAVPFAWSYFENSHSPVSQIMGDDNRPVLEYLHDTRLTVGVTVPIRRGDGSLATFTGIRVDPEQSFEHDVSRHLSDIGLAAYLFHDFAFSRLHSNAQPLSRPRLSARERECLGLCAQGLSAKQIAARLDRSVGTATLHLQNAARKLRARNRTHAVCIAVRQGLIDET